MIYMCWTIINCVAVVDSSVSDESGNSQVGHYDEPTLFETTCIVGRRTFIFHLLEAICTHPMSSYEYCSVNLHMLVDKRNGRHPS